MKIYDGGKWSGRIRITNNSYHNFRSSMTLDSSGKIWIVYDNCRNKKKYGIYMKYFDNRKLSDEMKIPSDNSLDAYSPSISSDLSGNVWIAYAQNSLENRVWGLRGIRDAKALPPRIRIICWNGLSWNCPVPAGESQEGLITENGDLPVVKADKFGRIWVFWHRLKSHLNIRIFGTYYYGSKWARQLGIIGGSDNHNLFGERTTGITAVLAKNLTKTEIFNALRNRRVYATTGEKIIIDFKADNHIMGEEYETEIPPTVQVFVEGTDLLEKVEIVKYQKGDKIPFSVVHFRTPKKRT